ncbi:MAG: hypothetical protein VXX33_05460 [Pseudomonadota bacterium]|nr:hypothetical protein [Pseudomonadota bacterium]
MRGTNSNTGQEIDEWGCAIAWLPIMLIENSNQSRHTSAAVESFRNEVVKNQQESLQELGKQFERPIIESK